jgi:hypothetical protein
MRAEVCFLQGFLGKEVCFCVVDRGEFVVICMANVVFNRHFFGRRNYANFLIFIFGSGSEGSSFPQILTLQGRRAFPVLVVA